MASDSTSTKTQAATTRVAACVGFALLLLTDLFALWGGLPLTDVGKLELNDVLLFWAIPHILTMAVVFLVVARFSNRLIYAHVESYILVAGLVMLAGALLLVFQGFSGVTAIWMVVGSAVLIAVGSASLLSLWEYLFVDYTDEQIVRTVLVALLLSSASYLAVASIPKTAQLYLFPVIVCAAGALLFLSGRRAVKTMLSPLPSSPTSPQHKPQLLAIARLIRDPLLCVAAIMFAIAITRTVTLSNVSDANLVNIAGCVGTLLVAAALYAARYVLGGTLGSLKTFNLLRFYRVLFPALTTVLLLLPIFGSQASLLVSSLVYVGYTVSFVLILPTCMTLARQDGTHPLAVFGVFMGGTNLVFAVATGFAVVLYQANYFGAATLTVGILLALYVLAMTYSVAMNAWRRRERDDKIEYVLIEELPPSRQSTEGQPAGSLDAGIFAGATTGAADTAGSAPVLDGAQLPVSAIASEYLLTERERDVLMLLTQGRDVPTIARQLFISENTVRTHTKNIYIKMNIHSKQELLDRVEEYQ